MSSHSGGLCRPEVETARKRSPNAHKGRGKNGLSVVRGITDSKSGQRIDRQQTNKNTSRQVSPMALIRMLRTETARLLITGFLIAGAGLALTQPSTAQADTPAAVNHQAR